MVAPGLGLRLVLVVAYTWVGYEDVMVDDVPGARVAHRAGVLLRPLTGHREEGDGGEVGEKRWERGVRWGLRLPYSFDHSLTTRGGGGGGEERRGEGGRRDGRGGEMGVKVTVFLRPFTEHREEGDERRGEGIGWIGEER